MLVPNLGLFNTIDAATLDHIVSHQSAFWVGYPFFLLVVAFRLILMLLFYELFKPVNKSLSLLAVYFNIVATTMQAVMCIFLLTPLILLGGEHYLTAFTPDQLHALALVAVIQIVANVQSLTGPLYWNLYYAFFTAIELACLLFIVWYAWTWRQPEGAALTSGQASSVTEQGERDERASHAQADK